MNLATTVTVLVLHGGGFTGGSPADVEPIVRDLRAAGYAATAIAYRDENPTGNVLGQIATVRRHARQASARGPVVAYGVSAGGTLAAALAARGEVAGAVVYAAPTNLLTWLCVPCLTTPGYWSKLGMDAQTRRQASPYFRLSGGQSPQLLLYGDLDHIVPIDQGINYFRASLRGQPDTKLQLMPLALHGIFRQPFPARAREWIQRRWPVRATLKLRR